MYIADLHIHSKFSRATSKDCDLEHLDVWSRRKGIQLLGTGDFTHPLWRAELTQKLEPAEEGLYTLREACRLTEECSVDTEKPRFVISGEISCIYKKNGRVRKVHNLILLPSLEAAGELSRKLEAIGNVHSDGRPILGLDSRDLLEITLDACPEAIFIPAHIWTPHFSLFGAFSGFDTIEECFEDLTPHINALETGLSSDPPMNWRLSRLDRYQLVSNSDAHSPQKLGREANLLDTALTYPALSLALQNGASHGLQGTIEFFPEEGKYHYDGHRNCQLCFAPEETRAANGICPACGKKITIGVQNRVEQLADRPEHAKRENHLPFESLVPLQEVIAASIGKSPASVLVQRQYMEMLRLLGTEFSILREMPLEEIESAAGPCVARGLSRLRSGDVIRSPGFDGEYGKIQLLTKEEVDRISGQVTFFTADAAQTLAVKKKRGSVRAGESAKAKKETAPPVKPQSQKSGSRVELNQEQQLAAYSTERATAVIAGPGTGKTQTLLFHIIHLIQDCGVSPTQITAVTFTNKAASEIKERLTAHFGNQRSLRGITIGTFHSICLSLLTQLDGPIALADDYTMEQAAGKAMTEFGLKQSARKFLLQISQRKNREEMTNPPISEEVFNRYQEILSEMGLMDFDDLLLKAFGERERILKQNGRFAHLLVDEFQDINALQYRLISTWNRGGKSLFVIGDPDQSIYGFRGSDSRCFELLERDYPDLNMIRLTKNYRSTPQILECALSLISKNPGGPRVLNTQKAAGIPVTLYTAESELSSAIFIAKEINRMVGGIDMLDAHGKGMVRERTRTRSFSDIAVLYRTHRQADLLEQCLRRESIPYIVAGRDDFLSDPMVRGTLGFFHFLCNPKDSSALFSYLTLIQDVSPENANEVLSFFSHYSSLQAACENGDAGNPCIREVLHLLEQFYPHVTKKRADKTLELWMGQNERFQSEPMERLLHTAVFHKDVFSFLLSVTLGQEPDLLRSSSRIYSADTVTLMTLHGAKGLEFPAVFLYGLTQGKLPMESPHVAANMEEERRLFYVGLTRAKDELCLLAHGAPSPFLKDIPKQAIDESAIPLSKEPSQGVQLCLF